MDGKATLTEPWRRWPRGRAHARGYRVQFYSISSPPCSLLLLCTWRYCPEPNPHVMVGKVPVTVATSSLLSSPCWCCVAGTLHLPGGYIGTRTSYLNSTCKARPHCRLDHRSLLLRPSPSSSPPLLHTLSLSLSIRGDCDKGRLAECDHPFPPLFLFPFAIVPLLYLIFFLNHLLLLRNRYSKYFPLTLSLRSIRTPRLISWIRSPAEINLQPLSLGREPAWGHVRDN